MTKEFNLPGLFRQACIRAQAIESKVVTIVISENDKDEFIAAMQETRLVRQSEYGVAPIPMNVDIDGVLYQLRASFNVPTGCMVEDYA